MSPCVSGFGVPVSPSGFCVQPCVNILVARMIRCCCLRGPLKLSGAGQVAGAAPAHGTPATDLLIRYVLESCGKKARLEDVDVSGM